MIEKIKSWFATWKQQREYKKEVARLKKLTKKKYGDDYEWYYQKAIRVREDTREVDNSMDILKYMILFDMLDTNLAGNNTSSSSGSNNSSRYDSDIYNSSSSHSSSYDSGSSSSSSYD